MSEQKGTFLMKAMDSFPLKVDLVIPPENPVMKGYITVYYRPKTKSEVKALVDEQREDIDYFTDLVTEVQGLQSAEGVVLEGDAAIEECKTGKLSMWLMAAIIQAYFEQYGEARRKNFNRSQRR